jgi:hypothetical protein
VTDSFDDSLEELRRDSTAEFDDHIENLRRERMAELGRPLTPKEYWGIRDGVKWPLDSEPEEGDSFDDLVEELRRERMAQVGRPLTPRELLADPRVAPDRLGGTGCRRPRCAKTTAVAT